VRISYPKKQIVPPEELRSYDVRPCSVDVKSFKLLLKATLVNLVQLRGDIFHWYKCRCLKAWPW